MLLGPLLRGGLGKFSKRCSRIKRKQGERNEEKQIFIKGDIMEKEYKVYYGTIGYWCIGFINN